MPIPSYPGSIEGGKEYPYCFEDVVKDASDILVEKGPAESSINNLLEFYSAEITKEAAATVRLGSDPEYFEFMKAVGIYDEQIKARNLVSQSMKEAEALTGEFLRGIVSPETLSGVKVVITYCYSKAMEYIEYSEGPGKDLREVFPVLSDPVKEHTEGTLYDNLLRNARIAAAYIDTHK